MWMILVLSSCWVLGVRAQEACFTSADVAGSVLGTFFSTLAAIAVGILLYWFLCRKKRAKVPVTRPTDEEIERHAYTNPYFQDDEPDKAPAEENGKPGIDNSSTKVTIISDKKAPKGNKKTKANSRTNPFSSVFSNNKGHPQRALDDSCIHQEPERIEVNLRGSDFTGLGFNICGNIRDGIYVRDVLHRGPAGESGKIKAGDRIMNVTVSFDKITIEDALTILSYASPYDVSLDVQKTSEQPGCFLPGHQKKSSMDSSTSGSMGAGGERLSHPIYRSQSSDDVSHLSREGGSNSKRSLTVGVPPVRLKKEPSNSRSKTASVQEEPAAEGSADNSQKARFKIDKLGNVEGEVQVVVHKEQPNGVNNGQEILATQMKLAESKKKEEILVKKQDNTLEPLRKLNDEIDGVVKEIFNPPGTQVSEAAGVNPENLKTSTNPFDVSVDTSENVQKDSTDADTDYNDHFPEMGNMQSLSSMLDTFMKDVKESIQMDAQGANDVAKADVTGNSSPSAIAKLSDESRNSNTYTVDSNSDHPHDSLSEFDITMPSLDLDDFQASIQASMQNVHIATEDFAKEVADKSENVSAATQDTIGSFQDAWTINKQNVKETINNEITDAETKAQTVSENLKDDSQTLQNNTKAELNAAAHSFLSGLTLAPEKSLEPEGITPDSLEMPNEQQPPADAAENSANHKKPGNVTSNADQHSVQLTFQSPTASISAPEISVEVPKSGKFATNVQPLFDPDLNDNIQYFENKMQAAMQNSPKLKSKRSSIPGKRKAPQPPSSPQPQASLNGDHERSPKAGNPFVVGLKPMSKPSDDESSSKDKNVVLIKSNNITTVKVNVANAASVNNNNATKDVIPMDDDRKTSSPRTISSKTDGNFSFGFLRTKFFEGLDKACNDDLDAKGDINRGNSIPRSCTSMQCSINSDSSKDRRSSSLGDLTKIKEIGTKSPVLEHAVSMDLKEVDQVPGGQLGEIKMHVDVDTLSAKDSSSETSVSKSENGVMPHDNHADLNEANHQDDLEDWIDEKVADKQNKKYNLIQGLFKKEKVVKRKKKDDANKVAEITLPVSNSMVISTATININTDTNNYNEVIEKSLTLSPEIEPEQEIFPNCKVTIEAKEELRRQASLSSSSLSEDSIDEERTFDKPKQRMVAVDVNVSHTYDYGSDSSDDETISPQSPTPTDITSGNINNENHESQKLHLSNVSIPIIPPIISSKDMRASSLYGNDDRDYQQASNHDEVNRPIGQVRGLSPTKFPTVHSSVVDERHRSTEENGDGQAQNHTENANDVATNHFGYNYQTSNSVVNDGTTVTTMHVTVTNNVSPQSKNAAEFADTFTAYPIASQGAISKTLIISNPQLSLSLDTTKSDPESPPPNLEPLQ